MGVDMAAVLEKPNNGTVKRPQQHSSESVRLREMMERAKQIRIAYDNGQLSRDQADAALEKLRKGGRRWHM